MSIKPRSNQELKAVAEVMMMGFTVPVLVQAEIGTIVKHVVKTLGNSSHPSLKGCENGVFSDFVSRLYQYDKNEEYEVTTMSVSRLDGMVLLTVTIDTMRESVRYKDLDTKDGVFSFVYNIDVPEFSELGYTFYERLGNQNTYRRIG